VLEGVAGRTAGSARSAPGAILRLAREASGYALGHFCLPPKHQI
jgi:hypothetical protein